MSTFSDSNSFMTVDPEKNSSTTHSYDRSSSLPVVESKNGWYLAFCRGVTKEAGAIEIYGLSDHDNNMYAVVPKVSEHIFEGRDCLIL